MRCCASLPADLGAYSRPKQVAPKRHNVNGHAKTSGKVARKTPI
jgi:hypothetical protein